jgi:hypothetical protein
MEIEVKTKIGDTSYRIPFLSKILNLLGAEMPVIEGYKASYTVEIRSLEGEIPLLAVKPVIVEPHGIEGGINRWGFEPWLEDNAFVMSFYPSVAGYIELRVYFRDLKDSDKIVDDYGRVQPFKGDIGSDKNIRYYYKSFRIYSLNEVLMIFFTGVVTIFTVLLFIITVSPLLKSFIDWGHRAVYQWIETKIVFINKHF